MNIDVTELKGSSNNSGALCLSAKVRQVNEIKGIW